MSKIVLIQRFYANFREGLFDALNDKADFSLFCHHRGYEKIKSLKNLQEKPYYKKIISLRLYEDIIFFPFLFFKLLLVRPKVVVTEGGRNTINNIQVLLYSLIFNTSYIIWDLGKGYMDNEQDSILKLPYSLLQNLLYNRAKKIYTYNEQGKIYFNERFPKKDVIILKNTINTKRIKAILETDASYPHDVPDYFKNKKLVLGYIGSLNEKKNTEALKVLESVKKDIGLIIVGDGKDEYVTRLKNLFKFIDCVFVGYKNLEELRDYYEIIDVIIMPGLGGLTIPQSYAFRTCVISVSADGSEKDIIEDKHNGYIVSNITTDIKGIIDALTREDLKRKGIIGQEKVMKHFSIENYTTMFISNL